ncbi:MAG: hypothetical protein K6G22_03530, partial [Lachnospiraceae bacterium]|nr:hypothetical protein [Lachnospiraceae bacterium]
MSVSFILLLCLFGCGSDKEEQPPRDAVVSELNGEASVSQNDEHWDAYEGLAIMSGDEIEVFSDSDITLLLDEDRHFFADEGSVFSVVFTGKPGKGSMKILLKEGVSITGIDSKPKSKDAFILETPNVTVTAQEKGTVFYSDIRYTDNEQATFINVVEGSAEILTVLGGSLRSQILSAGESQTYVG